ALDLDLELFLAQRAVDDDLLRNDGARGHRHGHVLRARAETLVAALDGLRDGLEVVDVAIDDGIARQRFDRVALDAPLALARVDDLKHLDGRRTDVQTEERRRLWLEKVELHLFSPFRIGS